MMDMQQATILTLASHRYSITIGGITRADFALVWRDKERMEFRRTAGGPPETITIAAPNTTGGATGTFGAQVIGVTHPDLWTQPVTEAQISQPQEHAEDPDPHQEDEAATVPAD